MMETELDLLSIAVLLVDRAGIVRRANAAAETTFDLSRRLLEGHAVRSLFVQSVQIDELLASIPADGEFPQRRLLMAVRRSLRDPLPVVVVAGPAAVEGLSLVLEVFDPGVVGRVAREDRRADISETNRRLLRNLAHEIRNPLGGIRGAAQLLESELSGSDQREYTRVIISEADRLQALLDRVLAPSRGPRVVEAINIHEVCERVRSVILAEHPMGLSVVRDYDASIPEIQADREQLIQVLLNVVRNAAQALAARIVRGDAQIELRTRIARQVTFAVSLSAVIGFACHRQRPGRFRGNPRAGVRSPRFGPGGRQRPRAGAGAGIYRRQRRHDRFRDRTGADGVPDSVADRPRAE